MRPSIRCDWPSVAKRGSRLTGLASIKKVREEGSDFVGWEQEEVKQRSIEASSAKPGVRNRDLGRPVFLLVFCGGFLGGLWD